MGFLWDKWPPYKRSLVYRVFHPPSFLSFRALSEQSNSSPTLVRAKCFHTLDAYVRLITLLVKHSGETQNTVTKVNLLNKVIVNSTNKLAS